MKELYIVRKYDERWGGGGNVHCTFNCSNCAG